MHGLVRFAAGFCVGFACAWFVPLTHFWLAASYKTNSQKRTFEMFLLTSPWWSMCGTIRGARKGAKQIAAQRTKREILEEDYGQYMQAWRELIRARKKNATLRARARAREAASASNPVCNDNARIKQPVSLQKTPQRAKCGSNGDFRTNADRAA